MLKNYLNFVWTTIIVFSLGTCSLYARVEQKFDPDVYYENFEEFEACLNLIMCDENAAKKMAAYGRKYTEENYNWDIIKSKYNRLVQDLLKS